MSSDRALPLPELRLVEQAQRGDRAAFGTLVRQAAPQLERLALRLLGDRHDAEDATQEAVLYAWRRLDTFRGEARFTTWMHRILVSRSLDALRRRRRTAEVVPPAAPTEATPDDVAALHLGPDALVAGADLEDAVRAAIDALPPVQRATLLLRVDHGLPYDEIAYVLGSTRNAVRANLVAARKRLAVTLRGVVDLGGGSGEASA